MEGITEMTGKATITGMTVMTEVDWDLGVTAMAGMTVMTKVN